MKNIFLKAKHWQLFILMFGVPLLFQGFGMVQFFKTIQLIEQTGAVSPEIMITSMFSFFGIMAIVMVCVSGVVLGWLWSVGVGLQTKIPEDLAMKTGLFKAALVFPSVYLLLFFGFVGFLFSNIESIIMVGAVSPRLIAIIFPLHLLAMIAMIYSLVFVAKTIKTAEIQRKAEFGDFIGEFFMIWFLPIGIWILQPKINEIYTYEAENHEID
jgi:hypothetical protein